MSEKLISVIVPVYNIKTYLQECLDSIKNQSYQNIEVIVVDDGSTDGSSDICDKYAMLDQRIHVYHKENGGAASARNFALKKAKGDFLAFVDSDDYIDIKMFEIMINYMNKYDVDVVQCNHKDVFKNKINDRLFVNECTVLTDKQFLVRLLNDWPCGMACNKLCKKSLFDGIYYEEGHIIDDEFFTYRGMMNATKILLVPDALYFYRKRRSSVMLSPETQERICYDTLEYISQRRINVLKKHSDLSYEYNNAFCEMLLILLKKNNSKEIEQILKRLMRKEILKPGLDFNMRVEILKSLLFRKSLSIKQNVNQNEYYD